MTEPEDPPSNPLRAMAESIIMAHLVGTMLDQRQAMVEANEAILKAKNASLPKEKSAGSEAPKPGAAAGPDTDS